ncbi:hypothetical protein PSA01_39470 [Pseudonocardia saturnea]|nr:hypothetical protein Pdca_37100 [Pseudonocardia autotrophica]GEC26918.1 hypothetical protein PSA01_39470 [Pseudonocardia saturnea]
MLGPDVNWVHNVRAAAGHAVLRHGEREAVRLVEIAPGLRAPVLQEYLRRAPLARAHLPVRPGAPLTELAAVADRIPVFRVLSVR